MRCCFMFCHIFCRRISTLGTTGGCHCQTLTDCHNFLKITQTRGCDIFPDWHYLLQRAIMMHSAHRLHLQSPANVYSILSVNSRGLFHLYIIKLPGRGFCNSSVQAEISSRHNENVVNCIMNVVPLLFVFFPFSFGTSIWKILVWSSLLLCLALNKW